MWTFTNNQLQDAVREITQAEQPDKNHKDFRSILERNLDILKQYGEEGVE